VTWLLRIRPPISQISVSEWDAVIGRADRGTLLAWRTISATTLMLDFSGQKFSRLRLEAGAGAFAFQVADIGI